MSTYSRFSRYFTRLTTGAGVGLGGLLGATATFTTPTAGHNPVDTHVTVQETGHPHATTQKLFVPDPMQKDPKIMQSSYEWPRLGSNYLSETKQSVAARFSKKSDNSNNETLNENVNESKTSMSNEETNEFESEILITQEQVSKYIDHTQLKPFASKTDIEALCLEAMENNFASVCVNPVYVPFCKELLKNSNVKICCVVGFPLGSNTTRIKVLEALEAVNEGADEIDMVISVAMIKSKEWDYVANDIASVVQAVSKKDSKKGALVKVILETSMLTKEEIVTACEICVIAGADYVKTSTGFGGGGATKENVKLMKQTVKNALTRMNRNINEVKVKASGGVKTFEDARDMIKAGASRLGTSSSVKIVNDLDGY